MASSYPTTPFPLISSLSLSHHKIPPNHYCIRNARVMALTHNTMYRGLNAIYNQAPLIAPSTIEAADFLFYCIVVYDFIHNHHVIEESVYFPALEAATGIKGLMEENVAQHRELERGLRGFREWCEAEDRVETFEGGQLRELIDEMKEPLGRHLNEEIGTLLDLGGKITSEEMKRCYGMMHRAAEKGSDGFKAGPFVLGCQDNTFHIDDTAFPFPEVPRIAHYVVDWFISPRYKGAWRFNPSDMYGNPKPYPPVISKTPLPPDFKRKDKRIEAHGTIAKQEPASLGAFISSMIGGRRRVLNLLVLVLAWLFVGYQGYLICKGGLSIYTRHWGNQTRGEVSG